MECLGNNIYYRGTINTSHSVPCLRWDSVSNHSTKSLHDTDQENFCRYFSFKKGKKTWCYVSKYSIQWCKIPECSKCDYKRSKWIEEFLINALKTSEYRQSSEMYRYIKHDLYRLYQRLMIYKWTLYIKKQMANGEQIALNSIVF